jgi:hypothetical protein
VSVLIDVIIIVSTIGVPPEGARVISKVVVTLSVLKVVKTVVGENASAVLSATMGYS